MSERRMFSKKIINSAKFLKMPSSSQLLYIHLGVNADDDGVVEAFNIMRLIGSSEDDLKILVAKEYVVILNEDLVTFIKDWREHNSLRADRKKDSIYQNLLIKILPEIKLLEKKERADLKDKNENMSTGRPMGCVGKVRLGKVSIIKNEQKMSKKDILKIWKAYPNKKGKRDSVERYIPKILKAYSIEEILRAIERYEKSVKDKEYLQYGSTFFHKGYVDYLDENWKEIQSSQSQSQSKSQVINIKEERKKLEESEKEEEQALLNYYNKLDSENKIKIDKMILQKKENNEYGHTELMISIITLNCIREFIENNSTTN